MDANYGSKPIMDLNMDVSSTRIVEPLDRPDPITSPLSIILYKCNQVELWSTWDPVKSCDLDQHDGPKCASLNIPFSNHVRMNWKQN